MKYYRLLDDLSVKGRWFLGEIEDQDVDFWQYLYGKPLKQKPKDKLNIAVNESGNPLDFTYASFEIPIVNEKGKSVFNKNDVNFYQIANNSFNENYYLGHVLNELECVDEENSTFDKFELNDKIRPDKAGQYKTIYKLKLNPNVVYPNEIFRIKNYSVALIVSENIKRKFEELKLKGVKFEEV
jgi:hypothetical protein